MYLVADESWSMADDPTTPRGPTPIDALNGAFVDLRDELSMSPLLAENTLVSVITFAGDAICRRPLAPLRDDAELPEMQARDGGTNYSSAFIEVRRRLAVDLEALRSEGYDVHRPVVFFISDGLPTDPDRWRNELSALKTQYSPTIIAFGIGGADRNVINEIATRPEYAFVSEDSTTPALAAVAFANSLMMSVAVSAASVATGDATLKFVPPEHFRPASEVWGEDSERVDDT